ncbi:hypothetical protein DPEC_G00209680 [Dallia pectoralis]|uniref:Uncharacterized protein n=1 Tax=Dallia pectoralis TaxID=75939 RepID=A0ACC2G5L5_DALPE|nr:hypothetical protein DPEC_G00209680 [Dallia pectoralis]
MPTTPDRLSPEDGALARPWHRYDTWQTLTMSPLSRPVFYRGIAGKKCGTIILSAEELGNCRHPVLQSRFSTEPYLVPLLSLRVFVDLSSIILSLPSPMSVRTEVTPFRHLSRSHCHARLFFLYLLRVPVPSAQHRFQHPV